ncbi:hypothetical protein CHLNCDRAFT_143301 [Chlorella variabilis]|uniref:Rhodanese domain-containing protein n=1 Tax=Chlorella variabilis TaxID=554065 RepID=E1Z9X1_CHLVA|nr:hypothetical protein CHLNCDRAFT_143301 [Chlorella variabilis]EFN57847.1 hypothetical protein CHLNCDRAFT_143301 [Chlorella variabilis]|eukprot:XP_005849949.1 hypothetical protein CHLNCDRAFT_143301 [Chlorella variabilis]
MAALTATRLAGLRAAPQSTAPSHVSLAGVAASLGAVAGAARADEAAVDAAAAEAAVTSAVQAAEAAVEQVAEAVKDAPNSTLAEAVAEATAALKDAEAAVTAASAPDGAVAAAVSEAAVAMKEASAAAASAGADVDILAALAAATAAVQEATVTALESSGVDAAAVAATAAAGAATATSFAQTAYAFLTTTEPSVLAEDALAAIVVAYLTPPLAKAGLNAARGYSGDVLPTSALDCLASDGSSMLVDIRAAADKEKNGVPDLPDNDKLVELEYVSLEGADDDLRNPMGVCAESTAVQIAALKRLNRGAVLYLMDEAGSGPAKAVAKQLRARGFSKVYVISGGAASWTSSKLSTRRWKSPSALLPPGSQSKVVESKASVMA